jgi:hypothetical protein
LWPSFLNKLLTEEETMTKSKYKVVGDTLVLTSNSSKSTNHAIYLDEIDANSVDNPEISKFRISIANDSIHYTADIEELRTFIEVSEDLEVVETKGKEGYIVPLDGSVFKKTFNKVQDIDKWLKQRAAIIEASGGPWTLEQRLAWRSKFDSPVKVAK